MSETITNVKVRFGADTKNFKKGTDEGAKAFKQFEKDAGGAMDSFAAAFGVNLAELQKGLNAFKVGLFGVGSGVKAAASSTGLFTKAMQLLKVALISTGIGALVVALGSLVAYFTKTERGAEGVERVLSSVKAIFSVLIDRASAFGEGLFKIFTGDFRGGWDALKNSLKGIGDEMVTEAKAAYSLEKRLQDLEDRERELLAVQSERNKKIAEARFLAEDETVSAEKRLKAIKEAAALERKSLEENKALQRERIAIMDEQVKMSESMDADLLALEQEKVKLNDLDTESLRLQRRLQTEINSLTREIEAETEAIKKQEAATFKLRQEQSLGPDGKKYEAIKPLDVGFKLNTQGLEVDKLAATMKTSLEPAKSVIVNFADEFNSSFEGLAVGFGESMGNLLSNAKGAQSFADVVKTSFSGLAVAAGTIIIKAGFAFLALGKAFNAAIKNPATALLAVAAGAALVAVGKATQNSLSNMDSSGGGGTFSSNAGGSNDNVFDTTKFSASNLKATAQPVKVEVSGEFIQRGTVMAATIKEAEKRKSYIGPG